MKHIFLTNGRKDKQTLERKDQIVEINIVFYLYNYHLIFFINQSHHLQIVLLYPFCLFKFRSCLDFVMLVAFHARQTIKMCLGRNKIGKSSHIHIYWG